MFQKRSGSKYGDAGGGRGGGGVAPGKSTLTQRLAPAVQRKPAGPRAAGGEPLPPEVRSGPEQAMGADFSSVRIVRDSAYAAGLGAGAVTVGDTIDFAPGRYAPDTERGQRLLAHELTHVVQATGAPAASGVTLGDTDSAAEHEADRVADAVVHGRPVPTISTGHDPSTARRGEAGVHKDLEMDAAGVAADAKARELEKDVSAPNPADGSTEKGALEVYSGNWMRDFSQINVPMVHEGLGMISTDPVKDPKGERETIGAGGAASLATSLLRAIAILELGKPIADRLVTPANVGAYKHEEHIDNPTGAPASDHLIADGKTHRAARNTRKDGAPQADPQRDAQLAGSAVPGLQVENPTVFGFSDAGLANHIYNSIEWAKNHWLQAVQLGASPEGRMHLGAGLHVVEDYFAHSNFIEVALDRYIDRAAQGAARLPAGGGRRQLADAMAKGGRSQQGGHVDTLFDRRTAGGRQVVTTGSFGPLDTRVSIGHIFLPKLPMLRSAVNDTVDKLLTVKRPEVSTYDHLRKQAETDRSLGALVALSDGMDAAGIKPTLPDGVELVWGEWQVPLIGRSISIPNDFRITENRYPVSAALLMAVKISDSVHGAIASIRSVIDTIEGYAPDFIVDAMKKLVAAIQAVQQMAIDQVRGQVKSSLDQGIYALLAYITDGAVQPKEGGTMGDAIHQTHEIMEEMEHGTALDVRLASGDLAEVEHEADVEARVGRVSPRDGGGWTADPDNPLPPSHSEVGKDHPPHEGDADAKGSLFYGLHRALALEADRHVMARMQEAWGQSALLGDGKQYQTETVVDRGEVEQAASAEAAQQQRRAAHQGFRFAQSDAGNQELLARPGVRGLLELADYFISHPESTSWWHPIFDAYVDASPGEVIAHIRARNQTRAQRAPFEAGE